MFSNGAKMTNFSGQNLSKFLDFPQTDFQNNFEIHLQTNLQNSLQSSLQNSLQSNLQNSLQTNLQNSFQTNSQNNFQTSFQNGFQTNFQNSFHDKYDSFALNELTETQNELLEKFNAAFYDAQNNSKIPMSSENILETFDERYFTNIERYNEGEIDNFDKFENELDKFESAMNKFEQDETDTESDGYLLDFFSLPKEFPVGNTEVENSNLSEVGNSEIGNCEIRNSEVENSKMENSKMRNSEIDISKKQQSSCEATFDYEEFSENFENMSSHAFEDNLEFLSPDDVIENTEEAQSSPFLVPLPFATKNKNLTGLSKLDFENFDFSSNVSFVCKKELLDESSMSQISEKETNEIQIEETQIGETQMREIQIEEIQIEETQKPDPKRPESTDTLPPINTFTTPNMDFTAFLRCMPQNTLDIFSEDCSNTAFGHLIGNRTVNNNVINIINYSEDDSGEVKEDPRSHHINNNHGNNLRDDHGNNLTDHHGNNLSDHHGNHAVMYQNDALIYDDPMLSSSNLQLPTKNLCRQRLESEASSESEESYSMLVDCLLQCRWERCFQLYETQSSLVRHIEKAHVEVKRGEEFTCYWLNCPRKNKPFNARYKLLIHMRVHSGEKPNKCTFNGCSKAFARLENLKIHQRSHTGERPYLCQFSTCSKQFSNSSDRAKHQRTHFDTKPYACQVHGCTKKYTDPSSLRKHVKNHTQEEQIQLKQKSNEAQKDQLPIFRVKVPEMTGLLIKTERPSNSYSDNSSYPDNSTYSDSLRYSDNARCSDNSKCSVNSRYSVNSRVSDSLTFPEKSTYSEKLTYTAKSKFGHQSNFYHANLDHSYSNTVGGQSTLSASVRQDLKNKLSERITKDRLQSNGTKL